LAVFILVIYNRATCKKSKNIFPNISFSCVIAFLQYLLAAICNFATQLKRTVMRLILIAILSILMMCNTADAQPGVHHKRYREKGMDKGSRGRDRQERRMSANYRRDERRSNKQLKKSYKKSGRASKRDNRERRNNNDQGNIFGR
jgi:hypothetical protein